MQLPFRFRSSADPYEHFSPASHLSPAGHMVRREGTATSLAYLLRVLPKRVDAGATYNASTCLKNYIITTL